MTTAIIYECFVTGVWVVEPKFGLKCLFNSYIEARAYYDLSCGNH
jgi:hypothetical protein